MTRTTPLLQTGDPHPHFCDPMASTLPELFGLMVEQCHLTEGMAVLLESYLRFEDPTLVERMQRLENQGVQLRERNVERVKEETAVLPDRGSLLQACFLAEAVQGSLMGIVLDMDALGIRGVWPILEMVAQLRHAIEMLRSGHEKLLHTPAGIGVEMSAILAARKAMERSYHCALERQLVEERSALQRHNPENLQRILQLFRHREIYRRIRDVGIEIANCGRVLQDIVYQFA
ncbi:MAG: hypothetical protein HQL98_01135 [Magnetococcales bacterium]|nr:hypothetical protein [Magnetococcales bacterium]